MKKLALALLVALAFLTPLTSANAQGGFATPEGPTLLVVSGDISKTNVGATAVFDREMLVEMGATEIITETIWTEGVQTFEGVSLATLLSHLDVTEGNLLATAINDYTVEIPVSDAIEGGPIIAYAVDGKPMSVRDKGPLWVIYPYDSSADYRSEVIYSRSIWQLDRIEVVK